MRVTRMPTMVASFILSPLCILLLCLAYPLFMCGVTLIWPFAYLVRSIANFGLNNSRYAPH